MYSPSESLHFVECYFCCAEQTIDLDEYLGHTGLRYKCYNCKGIVGFDVEFQPVITVYDGKMH